MSGVTRDDSAVASRRSNDGGSGDGAAVGDGCVADGNRDVGAQVRRDSAGRRDDSAGCRVDSGRSRCNNARGRVDSRRGRVNSR